MWYSIGSQVGVAVLGGFLASIAGPRPSAPLAQSSRRSAARGPAQVPPQGFARPSVVNLVALATFLVVTYVVLRYTAVSILVQRVAGDILTAIAGVRGATALSKAYLAPENSRRRLADMDDAAAIEVRALGGMAARARPSTAISGWRRRAGSDCPGPSTHFSSTACSSSSRP